MNIVSFIESNQTKVVNFIAYLLGRLISSNMGNKDSKNIEEVAFRSNHPFFSDAKLVTVQNGELRNKLI